MKRYRIYGKLDDMKCFRPLGGGRLVFNLIYAEIFDVQDDEVLARLKKEVERIKQANGGEWELRKISA
jgi:hypothetical protein